MKAKVNVKSIFCVLTAIVLLLICICFMYIFFKSLSTENSLETIIHYVDSLGYTGRLLYILLMMVQVVIAVIPGAPLEVAGGMLFGSVWGCIFAMLGILLGSVCVYYLVRRFGRPFVLRMIPENSLHTLAFLQDEEKLEFLVFILFLIPGIPKDILTYCVPLTKISSSKYLFLSNTARFPAVAASVLLGSSLSSQNYRLAIVLVFLSSVAVFGGYQVNKHFFQKSRKSI